MKNLVLIVLLSLFIFFCKKDEDDNVAETKKDEFTSIDYIKTDSVRLANLLDSLNNLRLDSLCSYYQNNRPNNLVDIAGKYVGVISVHSCTQIDDFWNRRDDSLNLEGVEFEIKKHPIYDSCYANQEVKYDLSFEGKSYRFHFYDGRVYDEAYREVKFSNNSTGPYTNTNSCARTSQTCGSGYSVKDSLFYDGGEESLRIKLKLSELSKPYILYYEQIVIEAKKQ